MLFRRSKPTSADRKIQTLEKRVLDLQATIEARDRTIKVLEAERDTLAMVAARDRERVRSEVSEFARKVADK